MKSALIVAFAGVAATAAASWGDYPSFKTPQSNNNKCMGQQQTGWDWGDLSTGDFSNYDGFDFSGFECANSLGERDVLTKRDFQQKVVKGSLSDADGPSFKCGTGKDFSAIKYDVSVSRDTDVEMHYTMPDGTTCKQTASCKKGGTVVQNKQCGGAKEVKFKLPEGSVGGNCDLGIHDIQFDCSPPRSPFSSSSTLPSALPSLSKPTSPSRSFKSDTPPPSSSKQETHLSSSTKQSEQSPSSLNPYEQPFSHSAFELPPSSSSSPAPFPSSSSQPRPLSSSLISSPPPPSNDCPSVLPQCLNTWIEDSGCKDNSDFKCYCKNGDFTKNVIQCVTAYGVNSATISKAISYLQGICAAFIPQNPGLITEHPKDIPSTPLAQVSTPASPAASGSSTTYTTVVVTETESTCTSGQVLTDNGAPTTLSESKISTITITATNMITACDGCQGSSGGYGGAAAAPRYTTIWIADTYTVPCTYSEGISQGYTIPGSSTITQLTTQVTVPIVQFTTIATVQGQTAFSVGLTDGPLQSDDDNRIASGDESVVQTTPAAPMQGSSVYSHGIEAVSTTVRPTTSRISGALQVTANAAAKMGSGAISGILVVAALAL